MMTVRGSQETEGWSRYTGEDWRSKRGFAIRRRRRGLSRRAGAGEGVSRTIEDAPVKRNA